MNTEFSNLLKESIEVNSSRVALEVNEQCYTYQEIFDQAKPLMRVLKHVQAAHVGIYLSRGLFSYVGLLACALSDVGYMPIKEGVSQQQFIYQLNLTHTHYIITDSENSKQLMELLQDSDFDLEIIIIDQLQSVHNISDFRPGNKPYAYIMFTSGSTGKPKAVGVGAKQLMHYLKVAKERFEPKATDRFSQLIELGFDLSVHDVFLCWSVGACLCVFTGKSYPELGHYFSRMRLSFCLMVPSTAMALDRYKQLDFNRFASLKRILFCGEPLSFAIAKKMKLAAPLAKIENIYGPTEATIAFTGYVLPESMNHQTQGIVPIGKAFHNLATRVINQQGHDCSIDEVGELWLGGAQVVDGYLNQSELTNQYFFNDRGLRWYKTGDLVLKRQDDHLHFKGRIDDQWQIRGQRVERLALEIHFKTMLKLNDIVVIPSPVTSDGLMLGIALIVIESEGRLQSLRMQCLQQSVSPFIPTAYIALREFPLTNSGKVDYKVLRQRHQKVEMN